MMLTYRSYLSCSIVRTKFDIYVFITNADDTVEKKYQNRIPTRGLKYAHLQELKKKVIPMDYHDLYNNLPHH